MNTGTVDRSYIKNKYLCNAQQQSDQAVEIFDLKNCEQFRSIVFLFQKLRDTVLGSCTLT